jgi:hypothetical protein
MLVETNNFISRDIDGVSLRVGRSGGRRFREIIRRIPKGTGWLLGEGVCFVEMIGTKSELENTEKLRKVMEVLEAGYVAKKG